MCQVKIVDSALQHTHQVWNSKNPLAPYGRVHSATLRFEVHNPPSGKLPEIQPSTQQTKTYLRIM